MTLLATDPLRWGGALLACAAWAGVTLGAWRRHRAAIRAAAHAADHAGAHAGEGWLVVHASQTGTATDLARRTAALLAAGGAQVDVLPIGALHPGSLDAARRVLFIASTYGEGDAPDDAARFAAALAAPATAPGGPAPLARLRYAVLALGDSSYTHYCGFGRALDAWLAAQGAERLFERIDVDRGDPAALATWQRRLAQLAGPGRLSGAEAMPAWDDAPYGDWRIVARTLLNPGSSGAPLYLVRLQPAAGPLPDWEAGDLAQVVPPGAPGQPRDYSIATTPADGCIELLVRLHRREDGGTGLASCWLCEGAGVDGAATGAARDTVRLRLRAHERFRLAGNGHRPILFIGNGSGLAGLRGLIRARIGAGRRDNWLVFGERRAAHDFLLRDELQGWTADGWLARLDLAFSRDASSGGSGAGGKRYVQDVLREQAPEVAAWMRRGGAIYVCGSLQGMAGGVHAALEDILGADVVDALAAEGRYRRDVY